MSDTEILAVELKARETQEEYMKRAVSFGMKVTDLFVQAGRESHALQGGLERLKEVENATGQKLSGCDAIDGKFAALSATVVVLNILRMAPEELRGKVAQECIDFLLVNAGLSEASMKQVLYNCLMEMGRTTGEVSVEVSE